ncbi:MAG TPA: tripartite tricarboxylate transporter substrate binding protein [Burkholderiaceae bacterium]|nr:tripartite tricarboxylate transporter substrate binding protein [Burkholderiaceae bacterium]
MDKRRFLRWLGAPAAAAALPARGQANEYPAKTVRLIVPSPAGSSLDLFGRTLAEDLAKRWGRSVIVESKPGAAGNIAASTLLQSAPDGYTLMLVTDNMLLANRFVFRKLPYDPDASFSPISLLVESDQLIVATSTTPVRSLPELIAYARQNPQALAYGYWSSGSSPQLVFSTLNKLAGTAILGVPYQGVGPVIKAMMSNEVQLSVMTPSTGAPVLQSGKSVALAIASPKRSPMHPDLPTTAELGFPQVRASTWYGLVGPAGLPPELVRRISDDVRDTIRTPGFLDRNLSLKGWTLVASSPAELSSAVRQQAPIVAEMVKAAGITPE